MFIGEPQKTSKHRLIVADGRNKKTTLSWFTSRSSDDSRFIINDTDAKKSKGLKVETSKTLISSNWS